MFDRHWNNFSDLYASFTSKEGISTQLTHLSIAKFRGKDKHDYQHALEALINRINKPVPLVHKRHRNEEVKIIFLKEAIGETDWGLRAIARVTENDSYQYLINALNSPLRVLTRQR